MASVNAIKVWWDENTCVSSFTNNVVNFFDQDGMKKQHIIHWMEENLYEYYGKWSSQQTPGSPYCVSKTTFFSFKPPYVRQEVPGCPECVQMHVQGYSQGIWF